MEGAVGSRLNEMDAEAGFDEGFCGFEVAPIFQILVGNRHQVLLIVVNDSTNMANFRLKTMGLASGCR
jgi:hypothetical protein